MYKRASAIWVAGLLSMALAVVSATAPSAGGGAVGAGADWASHGGGNDESGYSRLDQIKPANIGRLGLAWSLELPGEVSLEATPLAVDGVLYFTGSYAAVYAVAAATGKLLWKYDPETWKFNPAKVGNMGVNRGVAYADGRIFSAALDARLFALDARTGRLLWSAETAPRDGVQSINGAPRVFNGKVIIGNTGADLGARGYVTAYDAASGKQLWRFYTVPGAPAENAGDPLMERAAKTWSGEFWKQGGGGNVWDSITFDPEFKRVYLGTANANPYDPSARSAGNSDDNLYTASIVALDADTGKYAWHYQINPRDSWDFDCTQRMILADLTINGQRRKVLMQAPKNGFLYVLDRQNGKLISAGKFSKVTWADRIDATTGRPVEAPNIRYEKGDITIWPSATGAHSWQDMSYSPATGLVYIPEMQVGMHNFKGPPEPGAIFVGGLSMGWKKVYPEDGKGSLVAMDPVTQTRRWKVQHETLWNGGTLATAGNLVFQGTADGTVSAYDAASGKRLWRFDAGLGIIAAPISYLVNGKQYVSLLVGYGGSSGISSNIMHVGWRYGAQPRRLLSFALDGRATLAPSTAPDLRVRAVDDPKIQIRATDVAAGKAIFLGCAVCHGRDLQSGGAPGPDLRESTLALDPEAFLSVVKDGALLARGMPRNDYFTREQLLQIYAYIRQGARDALAAQQATNPPAAAGTREVLLK